MAAKGSPLWTGGMNRFNQHPDCSDCQGQKGNIPDTVVHTNLNKYWTRALSHIQDAVTWISLPKRLRDAPSVFSLKYSK